MSKAIEKPRNIFKSVTCFSKILWLFGLGFSGAQTGKTRLNLCNRVRFLLNLSWSIITMVLVLTEGALITDDQMIIVKSGWHYQYQLQGVLMLPLLIFNYLNQTRIENFFQTLNKFDELIKEAKWIKFKPKANRFQFGMILIILSIVFLLIFETFMMVHYLKFDLSSIEAMRTYVFVFMTEFYLLISFRFIFVASSIYSRFWTLNTNVR